MRIDLVSIFPQYFEPLGLSLPGRAVESGLVEVHAHDLRRWTHDRHRTVDDTPYGGGAGMVLRPEPWGEALDDLAGEQTVLVLPSPAGERFTQPVAEELAAAPHLLFACGRYEGIDARVAAYAAERMSVRELSMGDYVLNGGEVAALAMVEAVVRLLPGFMGNAASLAEESHGATGLLEYPSYTRPATWRGHGVPEVLLGGDHAAIAAWRHRESMRRTVERRPDLLAPTALLEDLSITTAVPADAGELLTLQRACWLTEQQDNPGVHIPALSEDLDEVRAWLASWQVWVARSGGRLVGAARARSAEVAGRGPLWEIGRLMVAPDLQGRGLGRRLLEHAEAAAPARACELRLFTGAGSAANLRRYRRAGYRPLRDPGAEPGTVVLAKSR